MMVMSLAQFMDGLKSFQGPPTSRRRDSISFWSKLGLQEYSTSDGVTWSRLKYSVQCFPCANAEGVKRQPPNNIAISDLIIISCLFTSLVLGSGSLKE